MTQQAHSFHIPVMGTGFTIDSPVKVAPFGIHSVISLVDDTLIEQMRKFYCEKTNTPYTPITKYDVDFRAKRITAYLNLIDQIITSDFQRIQKESFAPGSDINKYFEMMSDDNPLKIKFTAMCNEHSPLLKLKMQNELRAAMTIGRIDVNIMTKLDRDNYDPKGNLLGPEFSDALAALRGYAQSTLKSAIVFSAGFNRRLYSYVEQFKDFYADATGSIKKEIILKVSDFRSTLIQGKFFAKKGLWISEYRIESGLNCGGHAFATDGFLMGPILEEFKNKRQMLLEDLHKICNEALKIKDSFMAPKPLPVRITAQGGIGTYLEDRFLRDYYQLDATGWGTPFLLCPEASNVDDVTLQKLSQATERDTYLSPVSPLGVPFNNIRGSLCDTEKESKIFRNRPGSPCPKGHLASNTEFTSEPICTASRQYQKLKLDQLDTLSLPEDEHKKQFDTIVTKACICHDLGEGAIVKNKIQTRVPGFAAVCPGPNIAYFSKIVTLKEMTDHIYGRINLISHPNRPNMFIKELRMYIDYLRKDIEKSLGDLNVSNTKYFTEFKNNLLDGILYYQNLFPQMVNETEQSRQKMLNDLNDCRNNLLKLGDEYTRAFITPPSELAAA